MQLINNIVSFQDKLALEIVPEESDDDEPLPEIPEDDEKDRMDLKTPGSMRVPSQKSRPLLVRTPAAKVKPESPLIFPEDAKDDDDQILITEINQTEYREVEYPVQEDEESSISGDEDVPRVTIETVDAEPTEEDYDTDLEVEGNILNMFYQEFISILPYLTKEFKAFMVKHEKVNSDTSVIQYRWWETFIRKRWEDCSFCYIYCQNTKFAKWLINQNWNDRKSN